MDLRVQLCLPIVKISAANQTILRRKPFFCILDIPFVVMEQITPASRQSEVLNILNSPLPDLSVSRPKERVYWGIEVPSIASSQQSIFLDDPSQTMYVWIDALCNYLTTTSTNTGNDLVPNFQRWPAAVQVCSFSSPSRQQIYGKDILKFHSIYWLAFLLSMSIG